MSSTPIQGVRDWALTEAKARVLAVNPNAATVFLDDMLVALLRAAKRYTVDPAVLIGQSAHETGWGHFGRAVTPEHHNTCGLKVRSPVGPDDNPDDHARFADWDTGASAHAQHLLAYMGRALPLGTVRVDPRWDWVYGKHEITTVEELGGKWAPSAEYGVRVATVVQSLIAAPYDAPEPEPEPAPVPEPAPATFTATFTATIRKA